MLLLKKRLSSSIENPQSDHVGLWIDTTGELVLRYSDGSDVVLGSGGGGSLSIKKAGVLVGSRSALNFIEGSNTTLTVSDNSGAGQVDVTITANISGITSAQILDGTITGTDIASATITGSNIASGTITSGNILDGTITGTDIASATITGSNIASATITGANIASGTITSGNILDGTITGTDIASGTVLTSPQKIQVYKGGVLVGVRSTINLIEGTNTTLTIADNAGSDRVDITINSTGGGGGGSIYGNSPFDLIRNNTSQTAADEVGNLLFDPTFFAGVVRLVVVLENSASGMTASLELFNITDGSTVTTLTTTATLPTKISSAVLTLPSSEKLYGVRIYRTNGTTTDRVTCRLARFENRVS